MLLDFAAIREIKDIKTEIIPMPEWGGEIKIKAFDLKNQIEFEDKRKKIKDDSELVLLMLRMCIVNENDEPLFTDDTVKVLSSKNSNHLFKIFKACLDLNALASDSLEDKAKNL